MQAAELLEVVDGETVSSDSRTGEGLLVFAESHEESDPVRAASLLEIFDSEKVSPDSWTGGVTRVRRCGCRSAVGIDIGFPPGSCSSVVNRGYVLGVMCPSVLARFRGREERL